MTRAGRLLLTVFALASTAGALPAQPFDPSLFSGMRWRMIGPFRGGRTLTAVGVPGAPDRFYFGAVGGGVWKTENAGRTWEPIFDSQPVASIGAIAVAPSDPNVLYVGSGEADMRSDISHGNGVYRSGDAGKTWTRSGLTDSRQIGRIAVDPKDPNLVFVAALGHAYGPNRERGLYRSKDGGRTWTCVLCKDENTGAIDVVLDPSDSRTILAAMWQTRRPPWNVYPPSNGPGSGLFRSTDGGDTWTPVRGIPSAKLGRIRLAFAPSEPRRVYALVDASAKEGGLYVSEDGGATWARRCADRRIWERGWYFGGVTVDPKNADVVYACDTAMYKSTDGGRTFLPFKGAPGGDDYHRLWIDPGDSRRMILASDQGAVVSVDGGTTWSSWYNQPTAQIYHVSTDDRFPYWIYGAQQDSGAVSTPSRTDYRSITRRDWKEIAAGGESDAIAPDPKDANVLWGGRVDRFDLRTLQEQHVDPTLAYPIDDPDGYRGEWTLPLVISPRDPKSVYFGNQFVWRTMDGGRHWEKISADLTRESPTVPPTLDPITAKDSQATGPRRGVVYAIAPSPLADGQIWCGTDDGLIWLTRDGGKTWRNVTPKDLTAWSKVGIVEPSHFDAETAYAAIDRHRLDDVNPHILRTRDGGRTWSWISRGIPDGSFVNVVREDPARRGLLYAGTETGVFVSFDDGERWQPLQLDLPNCSIRDIDARHGDLVVATHGRSFWVLDDLSPLRQIDAAIAAADVVLFAPRPAVRLHPAGFLGTPEPKDEAMAENPPSGAVLDYVLKSSASSSPVTLEILDAGGEVVRRYASDDVRRPADLQRIQVTADWVPSPEPPSAAAGMHRFVWDLHAALPKELVSPRSRDSGPWVPPGRYTVRLTAGGTTKTQTLLVKADPRLNAVTDADLARQYQAARDIQAERVRVASAVAQADTLRKQIQALREKAASAQAAALDSISKAIDRVAGPPLLPSGDEADELEDVEPTNLRRTAATLAQLESAVESADAAPTPDAMTAFTQRRDLATKSLARWKQWLSTELPKANQGLKATGIASLISAAAAPDVPDAHLKAAVPWKPAGISSPLFESHAAFDPRNGDLYFVRSSKEFRGWRIFTSRCTAAGWSDAKPPAFAGDGVEADPFFTADGRSLYFISSRTRPDAARKDLDIWRVDRDEKGAWGAPQRLPEPVNSAGQEWFPRPAADGWLYFGSDRPGGKGRTDIWRARERSPGRWVAENLGPEINTAGDEYEPLPSPDGSRMIVMADGGLYETRRSGAGWTPRVKLGPEINRNGTEIGAVFSPSGRSLLFSRDTKEPDSGEFFLYREGEPREGEPEAWPPACPPANRPSPPAPRD